jgi:hydroxyacylglutathione hydrolase
MLTWKPPLYEYHKGNYSIARIVTGEEWKQNTYIVTQTRSLETVIIDPGDNARFIIDYIENKRGKVTRILLTHAHFDHVGALNEVSKYFSVMCELHKQDVRLLKQAPMYALRFSKKVVDYVSDYQLFEELCIGTNSIPVRSIFTPGHTKGSVCYLFDGFLFTGDTLLNKLVGRTDLPGSNPEAILISIGKLLAELPDDIEIFSGHGKSWMTGEAKSWWHNLQQTPRAHTTFEDID